jgi:hypothetical protein
LEGDGQLGSLCWKRKEASPRRGAFPREIELVWRKDESRGLTGTDDDTHDRNRRGGKSAEHARATVGLAKLERHDKAENGFTRLF